MKGMVVHMEQDFMAWEPSKPTDLRNLRFSLWYGLPSPELPNGVCVCVCIPTEKFFLRGQLLNLIKHP